MIQVHRSFMEELSDYLVEQEDNDACDLLKQIDMYLNNQSKVEEYLDETLAFITKELSN